MKKNRKAKLDLNAIGKGYGVDVVFDFLRTSGFENIFVDVYYTYFDNYYKDSFF